MALKAGHKRPLLQAPVGFGKTVVASHISAGVRSKNNTALFTVPSVGLVEQTVESFYAEGIHEIGVIQADNPLTDYSKPLQIACTATLDRRTIEKPKLVMVDECHIRHRVIMRLMEEWPEVPFIGLSATPWTKGLGRFYDNLIVAGTTGDLIREKDLCEFRVFAPSHPDLSGVKTTETENGKDFVEAQLSTAMQKGSLTADIVSTWLERGRGRPTLCFCVDRAHAMAIHKQFEKVGVKAAYQDGGTSVGDRQFIKKAFGTGAVEVVCSVGTLTTGIDWDVRCIVWARPTKSEILFVQGMGRGLRNAPGKDYLLVLDHSDTTLNLGFVTDIHHDRLDDGTPASLRRASAPKLPRECPSCTALFPKYARVCPVCKFEPKSQPRDIDTKAGELIELDKHRKAQAPTMAEKVAFFRQLKAYQIETGKSDGFIAHKYRAKFGSWPNDSRLKDCAPAADISPAVRSWLKSQQIRFAKQMEKVRGEAAKIAAE